jgi:hypothetical protein
VKVAALAVVVRNAMTGIEFESAGYQHGRLGATKNQRIISFQGRFDALDVRVFCNMCFWRQA